MVFNAASSRIAASGTDRHAVATTAMRTAVPVSCSQGIGRSVRPRSMATPVASPKFPLKMKFQNRPVTTGATAQGMSSTIPRMPTPRNPRLSARAVPRASGIVMTVVPIAKTMVRGIVARNVSSERSRSKFRSATKGVSGSRASSTRNRLRPRPPRIGGSTSRPTKSAPGRTASSANRRSSSRSIRLAARPNTDVTDRVLLLPILVSCRQDTTARTCVKHHPDA
jgi:hypothetical protein